MDKSTELTSKLVRQITGPPAMETKQATDDWKTWPTLLFEQTPLAKMAKMIIIFIIFIIILMVLSILMVLLVHKIWLICQMEKQKFSECPRNLFSQIFREI